MRVYGIDDEAPLPGRRPAVTLGVFDGVHRGHQAIIAELRRVAAGIKAPTLAITFDPHPRKALGRSAPPGICSLETRIRLLAEAGLDAVWVIPFTREFSRLTGREFAEEYFHRRLSAGAAVLGAAASFGRERDGNAEALAEWAGGWDMPVTRVPPLVMDGHVVSSTAIRLAVRAGNLDLAAAFLGRPVSVEGTVVHGQGRGRHWGFPTLNLDPHHELSPPQGVYITTAVVDGTAWNSVTNIGRPPTEDEIEAGLTDLMVETHLLDFEGDLYGRVAEIRFLRKLRDVMRFAATEQLIEQVNMDLAAAREWFLSGSGQAAKTSGRGGVR